MEGRHISWGYHPHSGTEFPTGLRVSTLLAMAVGSHIPQVQHSQFEIRLTPLPLRRQLQPHDHTYTRTANIALASVAYCAPSEQAAPQCRTFGTHGEILSKVSLARNDMFFQYDTCISPPLHQPFYNTFEHSNVETEVLQVHLQQPHIFFLCQKCINLPIDGLFCENCAMTCGCLRLERQACTNPGWFRWHPVVVGLYDVVQECWQCCIMLYSIWAIDIAISHDANWKLMLARSSCQDRLSLNRRTTRQHRTDTIRHMSNIDFNFSTTQ